MMGRWWLGLMAMPMLMAAWGGARAHEGPETCDGTHAARQESQQMATRVRQSALRSTYTCDLRGQFNQCRQYMIGAADDKARINELATACQSLGGSFARGQCPEEQRIATCMDVKFRRDVFYDAMYYPGEPSAWTVEHLKEVCQNLPGNFSQNQ